MSKHVDFAKERRAEGRRFSDVTRELAALLPQLSKEQGVDLQARVDEASARRTASRQLLAERLQESVVPLFVNDTARGLDRIGSCVLVRLDADLFAFTAAHVVREIGSAMLLAPSEGKGGRLLALPPCTAHVSPSRADDDLDVAVLVLQADQLGPFRQRVFLAGAAVDHDDRPDEQGFGSSYLVLGYSASRTQVTVSHAKRHIHQQSFHYSTQPVSAAEYVHENPSQSDHLLLDFDHKKIVVGGKRVSPPKLQGVSGGGIFHISRDTLQGPLVAIATQHRRRSRLIVGTRIKHFLKMVRELKA